MVALVQFSVLMLTWVSAVGAILWSPLVLSEAQLRGTELTHITAAVPASFPPQYQVDVEGKASGFAIDVLDAVAERAGIRVGYRVFDTWGQAQGALMRGDVEVIPNLGMTPPRMEFADFTSPVETFAIPFFVRSSSNLHDVSELVNRQVAVVRNNAAVRLLRVRDDIQLRIYQGFPEALLSLMSGEVDAVAFPEPVVWKLARQAGFAHRIRALPGPLVEIKRGIAVSKALPGLHQRLSVAVDDLMVEPKYQQIYAKWFSEPEPFWTVLRVTLVMSTVMVFMLVVLMLWRYRSVLSLNASLKQEAGQRRLAEAELFKANTDLERRVAERTIDLQEQALELQYLAERNAAAEERLAEAQRIALIGSWELHIPSAELIWSDAIYKIFEKDPATFTASYEAFVATIHPEDRERVAAAYTEAVEAHRPYRIRHRLLVSSGVVKWVEERGETSYDTEGKPLLTRGTVQDITQQVEAEEQLELYAKVFEHSGESILITDQDNGIVSVNQAFQRQTGYSLAEVAGEDPTVLASGRTAGETYRAMWEELKHRGFWQGELWNRRKNGEVYPLWIAITALKDSTGRVTHYIGASIDISERKAAEERIRRLAHHDALTGLINRASLESGLEQVLGVARRNKSHLAVMFIDMDRFKLINDTIGHHAGDALLIRVADRLKEAVRDSDMVARLGGDEFVIVLTGLQQGTDAMHVAENIVHSLGQPYECGENVLHTSPSVGISIFPEDGKDAQTLMKNADTAMYHVKESGRNGYRFFTAQMNTAVEQRLVMERQLREAITDDAFVLYFQPQVDATSKQIVAMEALVRWRHPDGRIISPQEFIPLAEEVGLIKELGEWVLCEACRLFGVWLEMGIAPSRVAINVSLAQLRDDDFFNVIGSSLQRNAMQPGQLELEITESQAMDDPEDMVKRLSRLYDTGVRLAIDDFGTGYSSLAYLKRFPIQVLKLDRSFVEDIEYDPNDAAISQASLAMAHSLDLEVVAEGVETRAQQAFLANFDCDLLQGHLFSKAVDAETAMELLRAKTIGVD